MRLRSTASLLVLPLASTLVLAGCGGGATGGSGSGSEAIINIRGGDPQNPGFVPSNTQETEGGMVADALFSGLLKYNDDTGEAENEMATSITTKDAKTFDVKFKKGWKFHDGTEVKADNFIKTWNYAALKTNAQNNSPFFSDIAGFDQVNPAETSAKPTAQTLSGLKKVNDYEFTITLSKPNSVFQTSLGYTAFFPLPDAFFADQKKWMDHPVGNGPFKFVSYTPQQMTKIERFDQFSGPDKAKVKGINFKIYTSLDSAYADLISNNLDFMEAIPPSALVGDKWKNDLQNRVLTPKLMTWNGVAIPEYLPKMKNPKFRKAISMAMNRDQISKEIFSGTRFAMDSWVPETVPGSAGSACGEFCTYNPEKAKQLMKESGFTGTFDLQYNADSTHKERIEATCNSVNNTFKDMNVKCNAAPIPTFQQLRQAEAAHKMTGMYRDDWNFDYPSPDNILAALFVTNGSTNDTQYTNKAFDAKIAQARAAANQDDAKKLFAEAEKMLVNDMPVIPQFGETGSAGFSSKIKSVKLSKLRRLADVSTIEAN